MKNKVPAKHVLRNALIVYTLLFLCSVAATVFSFIIYGVSAVSMILILVNISVIVMFIFIVIRPLIQSASQRNELIDKEKIPLSSWQFVNYMLSSEWLELILENNELIQKDYEIQLLLNRIKFNNLQSQINPHFLYNSLESIRGLALMEGADKTAEMAAALGSFFRYNISHSIDIVQLEQELKNIKNYFLIQQYRFSNRFRLVFDFDTNDQEITKFPIPKMTIQPLVENAVFHGLEKLIDGGTITIQIEKTSARLFIRVSDDGIGMSPETVRDLNRKLRNHTYQPSDDNSPKNGVALINIDQRIRSLYGDGFGLNFSSTQGIGTEIEISLPYPANTNAS